MKTSAHVVCHSRSNTYNGDGLDLITLEVCAPKFLDAEIEKHRMISSNSSSDRAIPFKRMVDRSDFVPTDLRLDEAGMQGFKMAPSDTVKDFTADIQAMRGNIVDTLELYPEVHKQHINRYLLPFTMQTKVMTATRDEWDYFLSLREHRAADPAMQEVAICIDYAITGSMATTLYADEWHLPYITSAERGSHYIFDLLRMSGARCARTSYDNHDGSSPTKDKDLGLFNTLAGSKPQHLSPLDHQGSPIHSTWQTGVTHIRKDSVQGSGNFVGWIQFRHYLLQSTGV